MFANDADNLLATTSDPSEGALTAFSASTADSCSVASETVADAAACCAN